MRKDNIEIYIHIMWTTWDREFLLTPRIESDLFPVLIEMGERHKARTVALNGVPDHIHWLTKFSSTTRLCDVVKDAKGTSARMLNDRLGNFKWRGTYAAYSVSRWDVDALIGYISAQKEHHANKTEDSRFEPSPEADFLEDGE